MQALLSILALTVVAAVQAAPARFSIREETEKAIPWQSPTPIRFAERARDYSSYFGRTLSDIGLLPDLVIIRPLGLKMKAFARPDDPAILDAITNLTLQPFPLDDPREVDRGAIIVTGKLTDSREFRIAFVDGSAVEASITVNGDTYVYFALKIRPNQAAEPSRTTGTAPASAGARASVAPGSP